MPDVFISYARADSQEFVARLHAALEARELDAWVDLEDIPPASQWERDLSEGITSSDAFAFVISPAAAKSDHCRRELEIALEQGKRIVPVLHREVAEDALPEAVRERNWIPSGGSFEDDFDTNVGRLVDAVRTDLDWVRGHTRWNQRAVAWERGGRERSLLVRGVELREAEAWLAGQAGKEPAPTPLQIEFVLSSQSTARRRQRGTLAAVATALLVSIGLTVFALVQRHQSDQHRRDAIRQRDVALAGDYGRSAFSRLSTDPAQAVTFARRSLDARPTRFGGAAVGAALEQLRYLRCSFTPGRTRINTVEFSADGQRVITAGDNGAGQIFRTRDCRRVQTLRVPGRMFGATLSPDGRLIATVELDGAVKLWNAGRSRTLGRHRGPAYAVAFSPDGRLLASVGGDGLMRLWTVNGRAPVRILGPARGSLQDVVFSPNGKYLFAGTDNGLVRRWSVAMGRVRTLQHGLPGIIALTVSSDGRVLAAATQGGMQVMKADTGFLLFAHESGFVFDDAQFVRGTHVMATTSVSGVAEMVSVAEQGGVFTLRGHRGPLTSVATGPGRLVATAGQDAAVRIWDTSRRHELRGPDGAVTMRYSPDGRRVVTAGVGGTRIWNLRTGRPERLLSSHGAVDESAAFSPDGREIVSADSEGHTKIWEAASGRLKFLLRGGKGSVNAVAFSPDGTRVAAASNDEQMRVWDSKAGRPTEVWKAKTELGSVAWSPNGQFLAAGGADGIVYILAADGLRPVGELHGHEGPVAAVAYDDSGRTLATAGNDTTVRIWNAMTGAQRTVMGDSIGIERSVRLSSNGAYAVSTGDDSNLFIRFTDTGELVTGSQAFNGRASDVDIAPDRAEIAVLGETGGSGTRADSVVDFFGCETCGKSLAQITRSIRALQRRMSVTR